MSEAVYENRDREQFYANMQRAADLIGAKIEHPMRTADAEALAEFGAAVDQLRVEPAVRYDAGKPRVDLIPAEFIEALARHYGVGAKKYAERNWEKGMSFSRCYASAMRHMLAFWRGEEIDEETGTPHVIAAAWNMAALHYYGVKGLGTDDRPSKPT
jgi:hypothetical protein